MRSSVLQKKKKENTSNNRHQILAMKQKLKLFLAVLNKSLWNYTCFLWRDSGCDMKEKCEKFLRGIQSRRLTAVSSDHAWD
jgi:hypothetical protein